MSLWYDTIIIYLIFIISCINTALLSLLVLRPRTNIDTEKLIRGILDDCLTQDVPQDFESVSQHARSVFNFLCHQYGLSDTNQEQIIGEVMSKWRPNVSVGRLPFQL